VKQHSEFSARDLALVAAFAALIAVLGLPGTLYPVGSGVPITAQTLGVMLAGSVLGARRGALAVLVFLLLIAAGMPWLAGGRGGLGVFQGASAGFLIGWLPGAAVVGALVSTRPETGRRRVLAWLIGANAVGGIAVIYLLGIPVLAWRAGLSLAEAATTSVAFLPGDAIKVGVSAVVTAAVLRGYPGIVPGPRGARSNEIGGADGSAA
jgi:biotin transport system substrate-specific component